MGRWTLRGWCGKGHGRASIRFVPLHLSTSSSLGGVSDFSDRINDADWELLPPAASAASAAEPGFRSTDPLDVACSSKAACMSRVMSCFCCTVPCGKYENNPIKTLLMYRYSPPPKMFQ